MDPRAESLQSLGKTFFDKTPRNYSERLARRFEGVCVSGFRLPSTLLHRGVQHKIQLLQLVRSFTVGVTLTACARPKSTIASDLNIVAI